MGGAGSGQPPRHQQRLGSLQQLNALLQQQNAVQAAVQQATAVLQAAAGLQGTDVQQAQAGLPSANLASPQAKATYGINLQQQQTALQIAVQETTALLEASYRRNNAAGQLALRQLNTLQSALQQTVSLQDSLPPQGGQLTTYQVQLVSQVQSSLMGLLTPQPPPMPGRTARR